VKTESLKKAHHVKTENVAGLVWLNQFIDNGGNCKLPSTPPCTGFSSNLYLQKYSQKVRKLIKWREKAYSFMKRNDLYFETEYES
jgi:hypothetical protein